VVPGVGVEEVAKEISELAGDASKVLSFLDEAADLLKEEAKKSYRIGGGFFLPGEARFAAIGDIHGDLETLLKVLEEINVEEFLEGGGYLVFLGDYVDRGPKQLESFLLVLKLKAEYPERVVTLRGNHEPPPELQPYPHDFPLRLKKRYGDEGAKVYEKAFELFQLLPYVAIAEGSLLFLHGGPPTLIEREKREEYLSLNKSSPELQVLEEVLWNDPDDDVETWVPSPRGAGKLFGKKVTLKALEITGTKFIVRGHEPAFEGYKLNHDGKVLTLFSRIGPPYWNEKAAYFTITTEGEWLEEFKKGIKVLGGD